MSCYEPCVGLSLVTSVPGEESADGVIQTTHQAQSKRIMDAHILSLKPLHFETQLCDCCLPHSVCFLIHFLGMFFLRTWEYVRQVQSSRCAVANVCFVYEKKSKCLPQHHLFL